jgi:hypothetical protein
VASYDEKCRERGASIGISRLRFFAQAVKPVSSLKVNGSFDAWSKIA